MTDSEKSTRPDTPRYYRISPRFWRDEKTIHWSDDAKFVALHLLTTPHRTPEGIFVLPVNYLVADLNWTRRKLEKAIEVLKKDGFVSFDSQTQLMLIRNALKYQVPENPNQIKSVLRRVKELPSSPLLAEFQSLAKVHCYRPGVGSAAQSFYHLLEQAFKERLAQGLPQI